MTVTTRFAQVEALDTWPKEFRVKDDLAQLARMIRTALDTLEEGMAESDFEKCTLVILDISQGTKSNGSVMCACLHAVHRADLVGWLDGWMDKAKAYNESARLLDQLAESLAEVEDGGR